MKRFEFPLQRVLEWREKQVSIEESKLERIAAEIHTLHSRRLALDAQQRESDLAVVRSNLLSADDLRSIDDFRRYARRERLIITGQRTDAEKRAEEQRQRLLEARRNFELLSRMRDKRLADWKKALDREIEDQAAESYLSRIHTAMDDGPRFAHE